MQKCKHVTVFGNIVTDLVFERIKKRDIEVG